MTPVYGADLSLYIKSGGVCSYRIEAYEGNDGSADDPVGELEVWIPFVDSSLEPAERCPTAQEQEEGPVFYMLTYERGLVS